MLRAGLSIVTVLLFIGMGFLLYTGNYITEKKPEVSDVKPPAPVVPAPVPVPAPMPIAPPAPQPVVQAPPPPTPAPRRVKRTHVVQSGESLSSISRKYFGTPDYYVKIAETNNLKSRDRIRVGQVLVLPDLPMKTASTEEPAAPVEASATVDTAPTPPDVPAVVNDEHQSASKQDFEPQQPTLNIKVPKK